MGNCHFRGGWGELEPRAHLRILTHRAPSTPVFEEVAEKGKYEEKNYLLSQSTTILLASRARRVFLTSDFPFPFVLFEFPQIRLNFFSEENPFDSCEVFWDQGDAVLWGRLGSGESAVLEGGERFRVGSIEIEVLRVGRGTLSPGLESLGEVDLELLDLGGTGVGELQKQGKACGICGRPLGDRLASPPVCGCPGPFHLDCVTGLIRGLVAEPPNGGVRIFELARLVCPACRRVYASSVEIGGKKFSTLRLPILPGRGFVVLRASGCELGGSPRIFLVQPNRGSEDFWLGKNGDCRLRLDCHTVSDKDAKLEFRAGGFILKAQRSRFGLWSQLRGRLDLARLGYKQIAFGPFCLEVHPFQPKKPCSCVAKNGEFIFNPQLDLKKTEEAVACCRGALQKSIGSDKFIYVSEGSISVSLPRKPPYLSDSLANLRQIFKEPAKPVPLPLEPLSGLPKIKSDDFLTENNQNLIPEHTENKVSSDTPSPISEIMGNFILHGFTDRADPRNFRNQKETNTLEDSGLFAPAST